MSSIDDPTLFTVPDEERGAVQHLESVLQQHVAPKLFDEDGSEIVVPETILRLLRQAVHRVAQHQAVVLMPAANEVSAQVAADILNVSMDYLIPLLETGEIPSINDGTQNCIRMDDLLAYKQKMHIRQREGLAELTRLSQEYGLYDAKVIDTFKMGNS